MRQRLAASAAVGALLAASVPAVAQPRASLDRYRAAETPEDDFHLSRPTDLGDLRFGAQLQLDYALNPLVYETMVGVAASESFAVVEHQLVGTLGLSLGLADRVVVYAGLPVSLVVDGSDHMVLSTLGVRAAGGAGLGDVYLGARVRLFGEETDVFALAAQATVTFPTSGVPNDSSYRGEPNASLHPEVLAELRPGAGSRIVVNLGARVREETSSSAANLGFGHELTYAIGFSFPFWTDADDRTHLDAHLQLFGDSAFTRMGQREGTALEANAGLRLFHASGLVVGLAAGPGLARGFGSPDFRFVGLVGWAAPREIAPEPEVDRDGDGLVDSADGCPDEPEDADLFEDADGCPDLDDDQDRILDASDACRLEPETANSWQDDDGCPDEVPDTDGDGIRDDTDACVEQPEDADGWQDEDGCPDPDNDGDGVVDGSDRCPIEAGVVANEGCPDTDRDVDTVVDRLDNCPDEAGTVELHGCREAQRVVIEGDRLDILEMVFFRTNGDEILSRSFSLLENVAQVLNAHPEIAHVVVEGHTDSRGDHDHNVDLSRRRAESVVRFLVEHGVAADRLEARGYGPDRPAVPDARTRAEHARNRRVEFHITGGHESVRGTTEGEVHDEAIDR